MKHASSLSDTAIDQALLLANYKVALDAHSIVAITDKRGQITYANDAFCRISQYSRQELLGKDHRLINSRYHDQEFFTNMWQTIAQGKQWCGDVRNRAKDGSYYWVQTTIVPFIDHHAKVFQYVAIRTDITDKITDAEKLMRVNKRLSAITEELRHEKKALHSKNIALNELIAHIERDKDQLKALMQSNLETVIMPLLETLKVSANSNEKKFLEIITTSLQEIAEVQFKGKKALSARLTPKEMMICTMIKNGLSVKDIAGMLYVSPRTVDKHRENIREKLGIRAQKINLASYLLQMPQEL